MQKLGILASVLLLVSVIVGPIGLSYAQTVDTAKVAKSNLDETRAKMDQAKADRLAAQIKKAADIKAQMNAKKEAATKDLAAAIAARSGVVAKEDLPTTADVVAKIQAMAAKQIEARKAAGGPSKVQIALEEDRAAHAKRIAEYKKTIPASPDKDQKYDLDDKRGRDKALKGYDATDQLSKESELKKENKKAEATRSKEAAKMHYNRK